MKQIGFGSSKRLDLLPFSASRVMLCHVPRLVPQQPLRVPKVARIRRGLGANIPKLKSRASGFPGLVKPIPQHPVGERLAALVLNQPGALDLRRPAGDPFDHLGKLASDLDGEFLPRLVLLEVQRAVPDVGAGQFEHVGGALASQ